MSLVRCKDSLTKGNSVEGHGSKHYVCLSPQGEVSKNLFSSANSSLDNSPIEALEFSLNCQHWLIK